MSVSFKGNNVIGGDDAYFTINSYDEESPIITWSSNPSDDEYPCKYQIKQDLRVNSYDYSSPTRSFRDDASDGCLAYGQSLAGPEIEVCLVSVDGSHLRVTFEGKTYDFVTDYNVFISPTGAGSAWSHSSSSEVGKVYFQIPSDDEKNFPKVLRLEMEGQTYEWNGDSLETQENTAALKRISQET